MQAKDIRIAEAAVWTAPEGTSTLDRTGTNYLVPQVIGTRTSKNRCPYGRRPRTTDRILHSGTRL